MTEPTREQKITIMSDRYNKMSKTEKELYNKTAYYADNSLQSAVLIKKEHGHDDGFEGGKVEYFWQHAILGKNYEVFEYDKMENLERRLSAVESVVNRKKWGSICGQAMFLSAVSANEVTPLVFALFLRRFSQEDRNVFEAYMKDPMFSVGQIVQLRANAGTDSVLTAHEYQHSSRYYYGCGASELLRAKKKTFMVIGIDPKIEGKVYAKVYKYKEKQGGCRYYKLLPMGEKKTYIVVEKFMKKCRTRAVKDARS